MATRFKRGTVLTALRAGPVRSSDWPELATTANSLRSQICQLRYRGFDVETVEDRRAGEQLRGRPAVLYHLRGEPTPPT